jgi:hypothetical protein
LICEPAAFATAEAIYTVQYPARLTPSWAAEPCASASEPRGGKYERNKQLPELALIVTLDDEHAVWPGDNAHLAEPTLRVPCDRRDFAGSANRRRVDQS